MLASQVNPAKTVVQVLQVKLVQQASLDRLVRLDLAVQTVHQDSEAPEGPPDRQVRPATEVSVDHKDQLDRLEDRVQAAWLESKGCQVQLEESGQLASEGRLAAQEHLAVTVNRESAA